MSYSEKQVEYLHSIAKKNIENIQSFLLIHGELKKEINHNRNYDHDFPGKSFNYGSEVFIPFDDDISFSNLKEFVGLMIDLEQKQLIIIASVSRSKSIFPIISKSYREPFNDMLSLVYMYHNKEFIILPELFEFINRGYITAQEETIREEKSDRIKAQNLTKRVAYLTITVSIIIALTNIFFVLFTSNNERIIAFRNRENTTDTLKVKILNPNCQFDSTHEFLRTDSILVRPKVDSSQLHTPN